MSVLSNEPILHRDLMQMQMILPRIKQKIEFKIEIIRVNKQEPLIFDIIYSLYRIYSWDS